MDSSGLTTSGSGRPTRADPACGLPGACRPELHRQPTDGPDAQRAGILGGRRDAGPRASGARVIASCSQARASRRARTRTSEAPRQAPPPIQPAPRGRAGIREQRDSSAGAAFAIAGRRAGPPPRPSEAGPEDRRRSDPARRSLRPSLTAAVPAHSTEVHARSARSRPS